MEALFMQNFEGQTKSIVVFLKVANNGNALRPFMHIDAFVAHFVANCNMRIIGANFGHL